MLSTLLDSTVSEFPTLTEERNVFSVANSLDMAKNMAHFWRKLKEAGDKLDMSSQGQLHMQILAVKEYNVLCQDIVVFLAGIQIELCSISFIDEKRLNVVNKTDRITFLHEVANKLHATTKAKGLSRHLSGNGLDFSRMRKVAMDHMYKETSGIFEYCIIIMKHFPDNNDVHNKLYICRSNLESIEKCFGEEASKIAGNPSRLKDDFDCAMSNSLITIVREYLNIEDPKYLIPILL